MKQELAKVFQGTFQLQVFGRKGFLASALNAGSALPSLDHEKDFIRRVALFFFKLPPLFFPSYPLPSDLFQSLLVHRPFRHGYLTTTYIIILTHR